MNVLLAGVIVGSVSHRFAPGEDSRKEDALNSVNLPEEKKALFLKTMQENRQEHKAQREKVRAEREKLFAILSAEVFDEAAYMKQAQELQNTGALGNLAKEFTWEERKEVVDHLKKMRESHHRRENRHSRHDDAASGDN